MNKSTEPTPAAVPLETGNRLKEAKQAGETNSLDDLKEWVERKVWTDRMLTALVEGVKGGVWYSLMDKVSAVRTLRRGFARVAENDGGSGVDNQSVEMFAKHLTTNLEKLSRELRDGSYRPQPIRRCWIPKPGSREKRPLGIPTVRDRVVQTALRYVMEPIFEVAFCEQSYGFRPGRGCKDALRRVQELLDAGHTWVVDADLRSYFDSIPHTALLQEVGRRVSDGRIHELLTSYLKQDIMEDAKRWTPEEGSPQGAVISPLLSNIYLHPLDEHMSNMGYEMIRYADDFVIMCRTEEEASAALDEVARWTYEAGLKLHPGKTDLVDATEHGGFDFLGYHFERGYKWPRKKSLQKLKDRLRAKTRRNNGHRLETIIESINRTLRGWFEYFKHSHRTTFPRLDSWIRMRLRTILRRRMKRRGRSLCLGDHQRWSNAFFAEMGLYSLVEAHRTASQSSRR